MEILTERLRLRPWRAEDAGPFARMNADPAVMEHFPAPLSRAESDDLIRRLEARIARDGYSFMAVERRSDGVFLGMAWLSIPSFEAPFMPCVEIGWRFRREVWGQSYASEAARGALGFGFERLGIGEVVSFTALVNLRSLAVMERIGMQRDPEGDFDHPSLPAGHCLRRHLLCRIDRTRWMTGAR